MLQQYLPIFLFILVALVLGLAPITLGLILAPHKPDAEKNTPYECGFEPFDNARIKFDVRFYLIAILFIVFDLELAFTLEFAFTLELAFTTYF